MTPKDEIAQGLIIFAWHALGIAMIGVTLWLIVEAITAEHTPKYYYLEARDARTTCVTAAVDWSPDHAVFCTEDIAAAIRTAEQLNSTINKRP